jgi:hypothetical protein
MVQILHVHRAKQFADNYPTPAHNSSRMPFKTQAEGALAAPQPEPENQHQTRKIGDGVAKSCPIPFVF